MKQKELNEILESHRLWLEGEGGERADLRYADLRGADLRGADLRRADLRYADLRYTALRGADLRYADLRGAFLWDCLGNGSHVISIQAGCYNVAYTSDVMQIGCERHAIKDWWRYDDETISAMDAGALNWWKTWKPILRKIIKSNPAEPTR